MAELRLTSWNLQGSQRPDLDEVASIVETLGSDLLVLQEVHRRQAAGLAERLGWSAAWCFKHWPVLRPPEGLAVIAPQPPWQVESTVLAHGWRFWSWRRRVAVGATVQPGAMAMRIIDVHLGADVSDAERERQAAVTIALAADAHPIVGDLNADPGSPVVAAYLDAGMVDAWAVAGAGDGPTNWTPGPRAGRPPTQRLDYVLVPDRWHVVDAHVPSATDRAFERYAALSDHLPLTVTLRP